MISLLNISSEMRKFYGFLKVPNGSQLCRFKTQYLNELSDLFHNLVDITDVMAKKINSLLSSVLITDTTGFRPYVTENNLKFYQSQLHKRKASTKKTKSKLYF